MKLTYISLPFLLFTANILASDWQFNTSLDSFSYSESLPAYSLLKDRWQGKLKPGGLSYTRNRLDFSIENNHWKVSALWRFDYKAQYTPDTAKLIYNSKNKIKLDQREDYNISLKVNHLAARGLGFGYKNTWQRLTYGLYLNLWQGYQATNGILSGTAFSDETGDYGDLQIDYSYTKDILFDRKFDKVTANGLSSDLFVSYKINQNWIIDLKIDDLYNQMKWQKLPHTQADITHLPDQDKAQATVSGVENFINLKQKMNVAINTWVTYTNASYALKTGVQSYHNDSQPWLSYLYQESHLGQVELKYFTKTQAISLIFESRNLKASIVADNFNYKRAQVLGFNISYKY